MQLIEVPPCPRGHHQFNHRRHKYQRQLHQVDERRRYLGNTDGIDYSGSHILIKNCNIDDGDDNIVAKPSSNHFCSDILIKDCTIGHGHGISVGGQTDAGLDGLTVKNCTFNGTDNGLRLKAGPALLDGSTFGGLGGVVKNVSFSDITMTNVKYPIIINSWYMTATNTATPNAAPPPCAP